MLGSDLCSYLKKSFSVTSITKTNYHTYIGKPFDIAINANGNSRRFWANGHPFEDFEASTVSVYRSLFDFPCNLYIYISSPDVYENHSAPASTHEGQHSNPKKLSPYGFHKYLSECIVKKHAKTYIILRCSMMLGTSLKKGPFFDSIHNAQLFISPQSRIQVVPTASVADIIKALIVKKVSNVTMNVGGIGAFSFTNINTYVKDAAFSSNAETQHYEMDVTGAQKIYPLKTSDAYVRDFYTKYYAKKRL